MCKYEDSCVSKPVPPLARRNSIDTKEYPCEKNELGCYVYKDKRRFSRSELCNRVRGQRRL